MYFHGTLQNIIIYSMKSLIYMELNDCLKILLLIHIEFSSKLKVHRCGTIVSISDEVVATAIDLSLIVNVK